MEELDFDPSKDILQIGRGTKRGLGRRIFLQSEIELAQKSARSEAEAARILGVAYNTYKKWAEKYGIFGNIKNQSGAGIPKGISNSTFKYTLESLMNGEHPQYPLAKFKKRLLEGGYLPEKCMNCGFEERRIMDFKVPLILDFQDGDKTNWQHDNLRMLCFNCSFLMNGNLNGKKRLYIL